ncbi:MAG: radical SAM protein [Phycisphaeraceae bacterium]
MSHDSHDAARHQPCRSPVVAFYEVTQACNLTCRHCRACAQVHAHPEELSTDTALALLDDLASFETPPMVVFTGGDPMRRADLPQLVRHATSLRLRTSAALSATPRVKPDRLAELRDTGLTTIAVSVDGVDEPTHRALRQVPKTLERAIRILRDAKALGLKTQVNTTITRGNVKQIDAMAALLAALQIDRWSVFFLVPTGRATDIERITPWDYEAVFERLLHHQRIQPFAIKTTEAPFFRRYAIERAASPMLNGSRMTMGVNDGRGVVFIGHTGKIEPSGFLPIECGHFPADSVVSIYENHPVFRDLQDPDRLRGKCGVCPYRRVCGGSRARAYAVSRDYLAEEPDCAYRPPLASLSGIKERAICSA